jgi:cysteine sulfinate desulfinase/cysteine desulfurase-like protein
VYLDYNATTGIDEEATRVIHDLIIQVADVMLPYLKGRFGNPSRSIVK